MIKTEKRICYIDIYKACGILLMVMGHIGFGDSFDFFIHAFHMPMFFFISGYLYKSKKSKNTKSIHLVVKKRIKSLLVPYLFFGFVNFCVCNLIYGWDIQPLIHLIGDNTDGLIIGGALWFLTAMLFSDIIFNLLSMTVKNDWLLGCICFIISFLGMAAQKLINPLPLSFGAGCVGVGLYFLGYFFANYQEKRYIGKMLNLNIWQQLMLIVIASFMIILNKPAINMRSGAYSNVLLFWINSTLMSILILNISKRIDVVLNTFNMQKMKNLITNVGEYSIVFLGLNQVIILAVKSIFKCLSANELPLLIYLLLVLFAVFLLLQVLTIPFRYSPFKRCIGK